VWRQKQDRRRTTDMPLSAPSLPRVSDTPSAPGGAAQSDKAL
jgi:hypothetical protein